VISICVKAVIIGGIMKKGLVVLLLAILVMTTVFASGGTEQIDSKPQNKTAVKSIDWWDHYLPLAPLHQKIWDDFTEETGVKVTYTQYDPAKQNEALLLAFRSGQSPDVFSMTFAGNPEPSMYKDGWFSPLALTLEDLPEHIRMTLFEGYTMFDGKIYSFPTMNNLNHNVPTWYFSDIVAQAGYSSIPKTYDGMRELAKKITQQSAGKVSGVVLPIAFISRMDSSINDWVYASGGSGPIDWKTGAYQYATQPYFDVFEFLIGLKEDGSVHPASVNMNMRQARERWAAGEGAILFDGSWNVGVVASNFPQIIDRLAVAEPVRKNATDSYFIYRTPPKGNFYISSQSDAVEEATEILKKLTTDSYYIELAKKMDQPPLKLDAVKLAEVHHTYIEVIDIFSRTMAYEPNPILRNTVVGDVYAEMNDIHPTPAEILQGYYAGAIKDWKSELVKFNNAMTKERDRAIKKVQADGKNVSIQDWVFSNWEYGVNFTTDKY
jgi:multiple sugar transport system substrate-binding protein